MASTEFTSKDPRADFAARHTIKDAVCVYPADLASESSHYVIFYPLVRENSRVGQQITARNGGKPPVAQHTKAENRVDPDKQGDAANAVGLIGGAGIGASLGIAENLKNAGGKNGAGVTLKSLGTVTGAAIVGAGVGALGARGLAAISGEQEVLEGAGGIALQVSERISTSYKANWESDEMGTLVGALAAGTGSMLSGESAQLAARSVGNLSKILGDQNTSSLERVVAATSKTVKNPYKEQFFKSMDNRRFTFDYVFSPKNEQEAATVFGMAGKDTFGIIQKFAYYMHPELSKGGFFFNYPSEWSIIYYFNDKENPFVRKISTCVLENMSIDYGAEGFTTFPNGCPTYATMRLTFLELELLTTQRVYNNY